MQLRPYPHYLLALTAAGALLLGACAEQSGRTPPGAEYGVIDAKDEGQTQDAAPSTQRPARRARSSMSMPFFSFAQSMTPRS